MIKVVITLADMAKQGRSAQQERWLNDKLKEAGIPVKGAFSFEGVTRGTITTNADFAGDTLTLVWEDDKPLDKGSDLRDT